MQAYSLVSYQEALATIIDTCIKTEIIKVPVEKSLNYVLAEDVVSLVNIPPFDNSAMDGFAVKYSDVCKAGAVLNVKGIIAAGAAPLTEGFNDGDCYQIMTGAAVPAGTETIIPVEQSLLKGDQVTFAEAYDNFKHIRLEGTDFKKGDVLFHKGQKISPQMVPALCSVGQGSVHVYQRPSVAWLSTGEELTDNPGDLLLPGKIFNSSGPYGEAMVPALGADLKWRRTIPDDLDLFRSSLDQAQDEKIDVVLSTGAVSAGVYDFVRSELEKKGWEILLHRAKVKPGKPILFARLKGAEGAKDRFFFGLPGNPVSSAMGLRVFVAPFLRQMQSLPPEKPITATLQSDATASQGLTVFMKAVVSGTEDGRIVADILDGQQSYQTGAMGQMNSWLVHTEGTKIFNKGDLVKCLPFIPE